MTLPDVVVSTPIEQPTWVLFRSFARMPDGDPLDYMIARLIGWTRQGQPVGAVEVLSSSCGLVLLGLIRLDSASYMAVTMSHDRDTVMTAYDRAVRDRCFPA